MPQRPVLSPIALVYLAAFLGCSTEAQPNADVTNGGSTTSDAANSSAGIDGTVTTSSVGMTASTSMGPTTTGARSSGLSSSGASSAATTSAGATSTTSGGGDTGTVAGPGGTTSTGAGGAGSTATGLSTTGSGGTESKFLVFLLLGQSNMEGAPQPENRDREENPRIKVLAYDNCPALNREYGKWYTAAPPLHSCGGGVGPGDYFAKTLLESLPDDYSIGLVPCGVNGAPIDLFLKDVPRNSHTLPPDNHWETGYEWIVSRAVEAQKTGTIAGILFHQGESNNEQPEWVGKVQGFVSDLRTDLALGEVPFLAGEVYYAGAAAGHNALIQQLPDSISNAFVISADGLTGTDQYHFDLVSQRELGTRYGQKMQEVLILP